jgi:hypothetical protein
VEGQAAGGFHLAVVEGVGAGQAGGWQEGSPYFPFDEAEDEQGQADDGDQGGDALVVVQEYGGDCEGAFEVAVAALDGGLAFVADEDPGGVGFFGD